MQANLSQAVRSGQRGDFDFQPELRKWCSIKAYTVPYTVHSTQYTVPRSLILNLIFIIWVILMIQSVGKNSFFLWNWRIFCFTIMIKICNACQVTIDIQIFTWHQVKKSALYIFLTIESFLTQNLQQFQNNMLKIAFFREVFFKPQQRAKIIIWNFLTTKKSFT